MYVHTAFKKYVNSILQSLFKMKRVAVSGKSAKELIGCPIIVRDTVRVSVSSNIKSSMILIDTHDTGSVRFRVIEIGKRL